MQRKPFNFGPIGLTTTLTTNLFQPGTTTGGVNCTSAPYDKLTVEFRKIRITNTTAGAITVTLYKGATGANTAGTEICKGMSVPANSSVEIWGRRVFHTTDFLVGGAGSGATNDLVIEGEGEIGVA